MGSQFIVVVYPPIGDFPDLFQISEEIEGQHLFTVGAVESFDISVLVRFSRLNVLDDHPSGFGPGDKVATKEFGAVVNAKNVRQPPLQTQALEYADEPLAGDRCIDFNGKALAVEVIDDVKSSETVAGIERIAHEVGRPHLVWLLWHQKRLFLPLRQSFLGSALLVEPQIAIDPVDSLVVPRMALAT